MIDREHELPVTKQAQLLRISRGTVYYLPRPVPEADLAIMRRLDRLHLEFPFAGSRMLRGLLVAEGCKIGRRHVKTLMQRMGIEALYRRPRTSKPEPGDKIYPYLLRGIEITRPNQSLPPRRRGCGRWTSPTSRWHAASSIWRSCSIGSAAACCHGACRLRWRQHSASRRWKMLWLVTASRTSSTRIRARSSRARPSPACSPTTILRSAWMARALGGTMSSSSGCGAASNTRRSICEPTTASARPALRSAATSTSTTAADHTRALTAPHPIQPTSPRCPSAWQPNPGRRSTYRRGKIVQKTGTTSVDALGNPVAFFLTPGQAHDLQGADALLPQMQADTLLADKAFDADERVIEPLLAAGKTPVIPPKSNRKIQRTFDKEMYKARHLIENFFCKLKQFRGYRHPLR